MKKFKDVIADTAKNIEKLKNLIDNETNGRRYIASLLDNELFVFDTPHTADYCFEIIEEYSDVYTDHYRQGKGIYLEFEAISAKPGQFLEDSQLDDIAKSIVSAKTRIRLEDVDKLRSSLNLGSETLGNDAKVKAWMNRHATHMYKDGY